MQIKVLKVVALLCCLVFVFLIPMFVTQIYWLHNLTMFAIHAMLALGLWLIVITGQVSFGQAAYMGIGGYASALFCKELGLGLFTTILSGGIAAGLLGLGFGYLTLRARGAYFFVLSFAFAEIVKVLMRSIRKDVLGGPNGILDIPHPTITIGALNLSFVSETGPNTTLYYWLAMACLVITILLVWFITRSRFGRELRGIAQSDELAESLGINVFRHLLVTFTIGCFIAGVAGAIQSYNFTMVTSDWMEVGHSIDQLSWVIVGGIGSIGGPLVGAFILTIIGELLRAVGAYEPIFSGATLVVIMLFLPGGLISLRVPKFSTLVGVFKGLSRAISFISGGSSGNRKQSS